MEEFVYTIPWRTASALPGGHPSRHRGEGFEFVGHTPFLSNPSPRDIDVRASIRDPFRQLSVRNFRQKSSVPVWVVADLSASMCFKGNQSKQKILADVAAGVAWSSFRQGDPFGFIGCDDVIRSDLHLPLKFHRGEMGRFRDTLLSSVLNGRGVSALRNAYELIGRKKSLVFLVSDFHFPLDFAHSVLDSLSGHDVVPVVLWDQAEFERLPSSGLVVIKDPETGQEKRLWMRQSLKRLIKNGYESRRLEIESLCRASSGRSPFFCIDEFRPDELTRFFLS